MRLEAPARAFDPSTRFAGYDAYLSAPAAARESAQRLADWLAGVVVLKNRDAGFT